MKNDFEAPVFEKGYPSYEAVNRKEADTYDEYARMLEDVSDERIEDLFEEMGLEFDYSLEKDWD